MTETGDDPRARMMRTVLDHVPFDGWSDTTFRAAAGDAGVSLDLARGLFPRGAVDLAAAQHRRGDAEMAALLATEDLAAMRFRERVAHAVRLRLQVAGDREVVRRATALFALPNHAAEGARLIWGTADAIWTALGDTSRDVNWYSKRATLSAVYGATVLYWLGDDSPAHEATWAFLDRRIEDVMRIEKAKAAFRENPIGKALMNGPLKVLDRVQAPTGQDGLPGRVR
ncbi:COQ9 family protein [Neotabrizicola shimadae]|uniref:COQ9 family protein n=1 Tax=Neotabrizicola shimadae TaxID=2807096 RepID=A0A8G1EAU6_9RHOB|nr:COQ9 family protein [Neotabrizicola shimadae]QYZ68965.1 COQ9 family protein [Neotabrizicola shimadae]